MLLFLTAETTFKNHFWQKNNDCVVIKFSEKLSLELN